MQTEDPEGVQLSAGFMAALLYAWIKKRPWTLKADVHCKMRRRRSWLSLWPTGLACLGRTAGAQCAEAAAVKDTRVVSRWASQVVSREAEIIARCKATCSSHLNPLAHSSPFLSPLGPLTQIGAQLLIPVCGCCVKVTCTSGWPAFVDQHSQLSHIPRSALLLQLNPEISSP